MRSQDKFLILSLTHILLAAAVFPQRVVLSRLLHLLQCTWAQEAEIAVSVSQSEVWTRWLAQLVECQSAVREVEGSSLRPDQHSGS